MPAWVRCKKCKLMVPLNQEKWYDGEPYCVDCMKKIAQELIKGGKKNKKL